jgi:4'-phosphopantetheinyl transferase
MTKLPTCAHAPLLAVPNVDGHATADAAPVRVWTMATAGLDEAAVAPWMAQFDASERARAARFVFAPGRIAFVAAHALARAALAGAGGASPAAFGFAAGAYGKPQARLGGRAVNLAFNLSHTDGMVGVALARQADLPLGFDLEPLCRHAPLEVARLCFTAVEMAWLESLPPADRAEGFFRLWTLKEAFIKATGKGLSQDLFSFWFKVFPPVIEFGPGLDERREDWTFEQRLLPGGFLAALGRRGPARGPTPVWRTLDAASFDPAMPLAW